MLYQGVTTVTLVRAACAAVKGYAYGDQIRFEVEVVQVRGQTARMKGVGTVDGNVVAEADMMARVVDR